MIDEVLEKEQWKELVETLLKYFSTETDEDSLFPFQAFQVTFRGDETEFMGHPCVIGRDGLCIMPERSGPALPKIPNIHREPVRRFFRSHLGEIRAIGEPQEKENLKGKCGRCEIKDCRGCRSLALSLTGDYLEEDPHCGYQPKTLL